MKKVCIFYEFADGSVFYWHPLAKVFVVKPIWSVVFLFATDTISNNNLTYEIFNAYDFLQRLYNDVDSRVLKIGTI